MIDLETLGKIAPNPTEHTLPLEENRRRFEEVIAPALFGHLKPRPEGKRSAVFLIAQQGAGKSEFARRYGNRLFGHNQYALVEGDQYQEFHPAYAELVRKTAEMPLGQRGAVFNAVRPDVKRWAAQATHYLREHGICMLKSAVTDVSRMRQAKELGFWVWAVFLGVPIPIGLQGVLYRFQTGLEEDGFGRLTKPDVVEQGLAGPPVLADMIEGGGIADRASVYQRDSFPIPEYDHDHLKHGVLWPGRLRAALADTWNRPLTEAESDDFRVRQAWLWEHVDPELYPRLRKVDAVAAPLLFPANDRAEILELRGVAGVS
jgi:hypothetical protein